MFLYLFLSNPHTIIPQKDSKFKHGRALYRKATIKTSQNSLKQNAYFQDPHIKQQFDR